VDIGASQMDTSLTKSWELLTITSMFELSFLHFLVFFGSKVYN
jgi:hypothetical protein